MTDSLEKFRQIFFEESFDALDKVEQYLLSVEPSEFDEETINDIFRSAHSLKGGSATFNMTLLADFTHFMETLLDQLRSGTKQFSQQVVDCLFDCLDCVRNLLQHYQLDKDIDAENIEKTKQVLSTLIDSADTETPASSNENSLLSKRWSISLVPDSQILMTGNEPLRYLEEIAELGEVKVSCTVNDLPSLEVLAPTNVFLSWQVELTAKEEISKEELADLFIWIEDEAEITIEPISDKTSVEENNTLTASVTSITETNEDESQQGKQLASKDSTPNAPAKVAKQSIRVDLEKIDSIINILGELVITQSMLGAFNDIAKYPELQFIHKGLNELEKHTRDLQDGIMQIRMLPIDFSFNRFPRLVRDMGRKLGKEIKVVIEGGNTEVDKTVIEELSDPLVHLVRNSIDHGIEAPDEREAAGKPRCGTLKLKAFHRVGNIVIEISDDGKGLQKEKLRQKAIEKGVISASDYLSDEQVNEIIFRPGFSTANEVTDISGRGVGMDVVRQNIRALGGSIEVESSEGEGTTFRIRLPLTLSILDGQLIKVAKETYVLPMLAIIESIKIRYSTVTRVADKDVSMKWRDKFIPLLTLAELFGCPDYEFIEPEDDTTVLIVIVEHDSVHFGIIVDELANHQQVVVKSLESNYQKVPAISGATILGDGSVSLIIDVGSLTETAREMAI